MAPSSVSAGSRGTTPAYVRGSTPAVRASPAPEARPSVSETAKPTAPSKKDASSTDKTDDKPATSDDKDGTSEPASKKVKADEEKPASAITATTGESSTTKASETVSTTVTKDDGPPIDMSIFEQILELDDDDSHEFSQSIVENYFQQAVETFDSMDKAHQEKDLPKLSSLGHFLKGSSAALGVRKVQATCESLQNYGRLKDFDHIPESTTNEGRSRTKSGVPKELTAEEALDKSKVLIVRVRDEYAEAEVWLKNKVGL